MNESEWVKWLLGALTVVSGVVVTLALYSERLRKERNKLELDHRNEIIKIQSGCESELKKMRDENKQLTIESVGVMKDMANALKNHDKIIESLWKREK